MLPSFAIFSRDFYDRNKNRATPKAAIKNEHIRCIDLQRMCTMKTCTILVKLHFTALGFLLCGGGCCCFQGFRFGFVACAASGTTSARTVFLFSVAALCFALRRTGATVAVCFIGRYWHYQFKYGYGCCCSCGFLRCRGCRFFVASSRFYAARLGSCCIQTDK